MKQIAQKGRIHYAWVIFLACCLLQGAILGLIQNCRGVFYSFVCADLGIESARLTLYSLFHGIGNFLFVPLAVKLTDKIPVRPLICLFGGLMCGSTAAFGLVRSVAGFYVLGFFQGAGGALLIAFICPLLLNNWFKKSYGLAMGMASATAGLMGILFNPILTACIERWGWRTAYMLQGLGAFAMTFAGAMLVKSLKPETLGMTRYGEETGETQAVRQEAAGEAPAGRRHLLLVTVLLIYTAIAAFLNPINTHFARYGISLGLTAGVSALMTSCAMACNVISKFLLGAANDRFGTRKTLTAEILLLAAGLLLLLVPVRAALFAGAFLGGLSMPLCATCLPMLTRHLVDRRSYMKVYSRISMVYTMMSSSAVFLISALCDGLGSYPPVWRLDAALCGVLLALLAAAERLRENA